MISTGEGPDSSAVVGHLACGDIELHVLRYGCVMSANLRNYTKTVYGFDHVMKLVPGKALAKQSPCADWKGIDVIGHVLGGAKSVLSAATVGEMPKTWPKPGTDPQAAWAKLRDQTLEALDPPDALHKMANTFFGPMPVDTFISFMGADLLIHTWDLARTAKVDERLDAAQCKAVMAIWKSMPAAMLRSPNVFGPAVAAPKGADPQTRMLSFVGRKV
jgi:uncharacterized protein (TIGR03086 family)